jgi:hypothetical protein
MARSSQATEANCSCIDISLRIGSEFISAEPHTDERVQAVPAVEPLRDAALLHVVVAFCRFQPNCSMTSPE